MRGLFEHPSSLPAGSASLVGQRPPFPAEMSPFKCHIECDDCLLDPRLINPYLIRISLRWPALPLARAPRSLQAAITSKSKNP
jgi:hypothetical protein